MRRGQSCLWAVIAAAMLVPMGASAQYVFYTDTNQPSPALRRCSPDGSSPAARALPANTLPEGLAYDAVHNQLYWAEATFSGARIRRTDAGLGAGTTVLAGLGSLRGIAVDGATGWMYWTSSDHVGPATINRAHLDGSGAQVLLSLAGFNPRQITIDPVAGKLYWAELEFPGIARCNFDGTVGEILVLGPTSRPYGVAINPATLEVWWSEYATGFIQSAVFPPSPQSAPADATDPPEQDLAARSAVMLVSARAGSAPTAAAISVGGFVNPTYLALDLVNSRLFVSQAGAGVTALRRLNLVTQVITTLSAPQTSFGGVAWYPNSLVDVSDGTPSRPPVALVLRAENPARGNATMEFALPDEADVTLDVLDTAGRRVASLAEGRHAAGEHRLAWTGQTGAGRAAPGMYLLRLEVGGRQLTKRFAYLR